jgi:hypothetical protein
MKKADIYVNLNHDEWDGPTYSVRSRETDNYGRVIDHIKSGVMSLDEFAVQEAGWRKAFNTGSKNVHAFARGVLYTKGDGEEKLLSAKASPSQNVVPVTYDLYLGAFISAVTGIPIRSGDAAVFTQKGLSVVNPHYGHVKNTYGYQHVRNSHGRSE